MPELLKQKSDFVIGLGAADEEQFAAVDGGHADVEQLDRSEFFEDGARHQSGGEFAQVLAEGDRQAVGEEGDEQMRFDAGGFLMEDGPQTQVAFERAERFLDQHQLHVITARAASSRWSRAFGVPTK